MRRLGLVLSTVLVLAAVLAMPASAWGSGAFPSNISLPDGFTPEGIAIGRGTSFYVGSIAAGAIYRGDLRTGQGAEFVHFSPGQGAAGMKVDRRTNYLFVAGAVSGQLWVYDAGTGTQIATYQLATGATLINDLIITRRAVYVTDSFRPYFYQIPLGPGGQLPSQSAVRAIPLGGDFPAYFQPPSTNSLVLNSNGIAATPDGKWLIIVHSLAGKLFRVDPRTGSAVAIDLHGGNVQWGDGILFVGRMLYVIQNSSQISVISFSRDFTEGTQRVLTNADLGGVLETPSTGAAFGDAIYVVNARYDVAPPPQPAPGVSFNVVRIPLQQLER